MAQHFVSTASVDLTPGDFTQSSDCGHAGCGCGGSADHGPRPPVATPVRPWRPAQTLRAIAIAIFRQGDKILAAPVHDDAGQIKGWRPLGGGIDFGERAETALIREIREETEQEIQNLVPLGVLENLFDHHGAQGHEIVFVFQADFTQPAIYEAEQLAFCEGGTHGEAKWISLAKAKAGRIALYPEGLAELL